MGAVFRGVWCNQDVAIKRLKVEDEDAFVREVSVLNCLRHPNILMLYGYSVDGKGNKYIITEYVDAGNLDDALSQRKLKDFEKKISILLGIAQGMAFLHSRENKIVHRDLKPQNILMKKDGTCKLCDFGLSRVADNSLTVGVSFGTLQYMCPELLQHASYDETCDVYSFGILMHEVFTFEKPFSSSGSNSSQGFVMNQFTTIGLQVIQGHRPMVPSEVIQWGQGKDNEESLALYLSNFFSKSNELSKKKLSSFQRAAMTHQYFSLCTQCWSPSAEHRPSFERIVSQLQNIHQQLFKIKKKYS